LDYSELTLKISAKLYEEAKAWEHTRYLAAVIINMQRDPKKPPVKPEKLIRLPTDKANDPRQGLAEMFKMFHVEHNQTD
jgi:hypothetical protein